MALKLFKIKRNETAIIFGASIMMLLLGIIAQITDKNSKSYTEYSTAFMMVMPLAVNYFMQPATMKRDFNMTVGMGKTRKSFFISQIILETCKYVAIVGIGFISHTIQKEIFSGLEEKIGLSSFFKWDVMCVTVIFIMTFSLFISSMLLEFGKKAFWVLWVAYMLVCLLPARVQSAMEEKNNSVFAKMGNWIINTIDKTHKEEVMTAGIIAAVIFLFLSMIMIFNEDVKD